MTVASTTARKTFAGNGSTTSFATSPMVFFDATDLTVYVVTTATGAVVATLTLNTDYTVTGGSGTTGTVATTGLYGAPATGQTLVIVRSLPRTQETDFENNDPNDADVAEEVADRIVMIAQELDAKLARTARLADSDVSGADPTLPSPEASKFLAWNASADALVNTSGGPDAAIPVSTFMETVLDDTTAAAARATLGARASTLSTQQKFTSGSSATYTTPANCKQIRVRMKGGGGGGGGSGSASQTGGGTGGTTSFNGITALGGSPGSPASSSPGAGGTGGSGTAFRVAGAPGMPYRINVVSGTNVEATGGGGGGTGAGAGGPGANPGDAAVANSGGGGGSGGVTSTAFGDIGTFSIAGGGGEGEYAEFLIDSPSATYTYSVGAGGTNGSAGTGGNAGNLGGSGFIVVDEYY